MAGADDHMRLIKATLKNTFPSIDGAVNVTQAQLNTLVTGVTLLSPSGAKLRTNDYLSSSAVGRVSVFADNGAGTAVSVLDLFGSGPTAAQVHGNLSVDQAVTATQGFSGPGIVPIGTMVMWLADALPTQGVWCWANGGTLSRTGNGAALFALWGTTYGAGDGSTTFNVPNMQEAVPVGKSTMGGAASPGLLASIAAGLKGALGGLFGTDTTTLSASQIPTITANGSMTGTASGSISGSASGVILGGTSGGGGVGGGGNFGLSGNAGVSGSFSGSASVSGSVTSNNTGGGAHSNLQPSRTVNFIIRIG
ncbi:tail fiber protein [Bradyrhizobium barranii subsp. apii]|uniref:phage tail protein n=1 Tax=Bradyrhizobium barranii TaxID=2992140 RepID=UPI00204E2F29|nr:tail fiber protein [Bradyrhizobium barranii]UPT96300.1 tail fiber protein [Bradyrhizobium barranii subsp. apii]